jgi:drug/metabolite transporter (DMT)-like permease
MRLVLAAALLFLGAYFCWVAYGVLSNLWADYQDSSPSTYLFFGLPALALGVAALVSAVLVVRGRRD